MNKAKFKGGFIIIGATSINARHVSQVIDEVNGCKLILMDGRAFGTTTQANIVRRYCDMANRGLEWFVFTG